MPYKFNPISGQLDYYENAGTLPDGSVTTAKLGGDITTAGKALLDDADAAAQRTTLGLGNSATLNTGTTTGTVAAGDDSRLSDARTPTSHTHGNITNDGQVGSTAGLPVVTGTAGVVTTLALGTANQVLKVNSGATGVEFGDASGGVSSVTATAPLTSSGGATPDISTSIATNRVVGRSTAGTGVMEELTPVGISVSGGNITGIGGTLGTTDNVVARADGTGGYTVQPSGLIVEDAIVSVTGITGDAGTDVITAPGTAFVSGQPIRFTALTGGTGLNTTTNYFVVNPVGATFQVETSIGGGAINFTTNITAGTLLTGHSVQANVTLSENTPEANSSLVLTPKGTGAFILGPKPDGTAVGGNARGARAVDLQVSKSAASHVASGGSSFLSGFQSTSSGDTSFCHGVQSTASGGQSVSIGGNSNSASGAQSIVAGGGLSGAGNTASSTAAATLGGLRALADRYSMHAHSAGQFAALGDAQRARFVMRNKTTTNSAVELFLDGSSARLTIPSGKSVGGTIQISGVTSGGETALLYIRQFLIRNRNGTTALIGSIQTVGTDIEGIDLTNPSLTADDTNDALKVEVTGYTPVTGMTATASTDLINKVAHGFSNNDDIVFTSLTGGAGLTANTVTYWVINANADDFQVSATRGGAAVNITTDYSDMTATRVIRWVANVDCTEIGHGT